MQALTRLHRLYYNFCQRAFAVLGKVHPLPKPSKKGVWALNLSTMKEKIAEDFQIEHKVSAMDEKNDPHIHKTFQVVLILSDGISCVIGEKRYNLEKNSMLLFNNMDLHRLVRAPHAKWNDYYTLHFNPVFVQYFLSESTNILECFYYRSFNDPNILTFNHDQLMGIMDIFNKLNYCYNSSYEDGAYGREIRLKCLLGSLLIKINLAYRCRHGISIGADTRSYKHIYSIMSYIQQNYAEDLTLDLLASKFHISKFYMCELFKKVMGTSPSRYLINCRIMKAKEMLINNYSVDDVCALTGYNNLSHFSRSFKQNVGKSPKQYQIAFRK